MADEVTLTVKYLSSPRLLRLQLQDAALRRHFLVQVGCPPQQSSILIQATPHACGAHNEGLSSQPFNLMRPVHALLPCHVELQYSQSWSLLYLDPCVSGAPGNSSKPFDVLIPCAGADLPARLPEPHCQGWRSAAAQKGRPAQQAGVAPYEQLLADSASDRCGQCRSFRTVHCTPLLLCKLPGSMLSMLQGHCVMQCDDSEGFFTLDQPHAIE